MLDQERIELLKRAVDLALKMGECDKFCNRPPLDIWRGDPSGLLVWLHEHQGECTCWKRAVRDLVAKAEK